jgi:hypothetical protein
MTVNQSIGQSSMGINYKGSQGQTERAVVIQEEEEGFDVNLLLIQIDFLSEKATVPLSLLNRNSN